MNYGKLELWSAERALDRSTLSGTLNTDPSMTVQSQADDADINVLMRRMGVTGIIPQFGRVPEYGDFTFEGDYRDALELVRQADEGFAAFPAEVRARFENNPAAFLDWFHDPVRSRDDLEKVGLVAAKPLPVEPAVVKVEVVNPAVKP